jgi:CheY-like chemotaxis protein
MRRYWSRTCGRLGAAQNECASASRLYVRRPTLAKEAIRQSPFGCLLSICLGHGLVFIMIKCLPLIAVVDDDPAVLKALARLLRTRGFDANGYGSAREFLAALPHRPPECLILDLQMPEMSGLDLLVHFQRNGIRIPTIVITGQTDRHVRDSCEASGIVAFLPKPVDDAALFAAIAAARNDAAVK